MKSTLSSIGQSHTVKEAVPGLLARRLSYFLDLRRVYRSLPGHLRLRFWAIMALQFTRSVIESLTIFVIALLTLSVASPSSLRSRALYGWVVPYLPDYIQFRLAGDRTLITSMCLMVVLFIIFKNLIVFVTTSYSTVFSETIGIYTNQEAFKRYFAKDYLWHISPESKKLLNRVNCHRQLTSMISSLLQLMGKTVCCMVMFTFLFIINPHLTATVMSIFGVMCVTMYALLRKKVEQTGEKLGEITSRQGWATTIATRGIREILIYRKQDVFLNSIVDHMREGVPLKTFTAVANRVPGWSLEVMGFIIIFSSMVYMVNAGAPIPEIVSAMSMLLLTAWRVLPMISSAMAHAVFIRSVRARALSCLEVLEEFNDGWLPARRQADPNFHFREKIMLDHVSFAYPGARKNCLQAVTLEIRKGEKIGLVGRSGAGKSTLGMILSGLIPPASGTMFVDGKNAADDIESYRQRIGYVPQLPLLLPGSIADNVALSEWGEDYDRTRILAACEMAAMDFAAGTTGARIRIGDGGEGLSGGEAQRVSIARALFTNPEILIFDEATSALDSASENRIGETLNSLGGDRTVVVIAHRLSTVEKCDRVVWLDQGRIVDIGPPAIILERYVAAMEKNDFYQMESKG